MNANAITLDMDSAEAVLALGHEAERATAQALAEAAVLFFRQALTMEARAELLEDEDGLLDPVIEIHPGKGPGVAWLTLSLGGQLGEQDVLTLWVEIGPDGEATGQTWNRAEIDELEKTR